MKNKYVKLFLDLLWIILKVFLLIIIVMVGERLLLGLFSKNLDTTEKYYSPLNQSAILCLEYSVLFLAIVLTNIKHVAEHTKLYIDKRMLLWIGIGVGYQVFCSLTIYLLHYLDIIKVSSEQNYNMILYTLAIGILAPITEELIFRDIIYQKCQIIKHEPIQVVITSLMFALFHLNLIQGAYAFIFAIILFYIRKNTDNVYPCIVTHMTANLLGIFIMMI